jgi:hypothetical protein
MMSSTPVATRVTSASARRDEASRFADERVAGSASRRATALRL